MGGKAIKAACCAALKTALRGMGLYAAIKTTPYPARIVAITSVVTAAAKAAGSRGFNPNRKHSRYFEAASATGTLITSPAVTRINTSRRTPYSTVDARAPSAIRIPISLVRFATLYDIVAYRPTQEITSARIANAVHSRAKMIS